MIAAVGEMARMTREQALQNPRIARALAKADAEHSARERRRADARISAVPTTPPKKTIPNAPWSPYRSKLEWLYAEHLTAMELAGEIDGWQYEPCTFRLPGRLRYRPDFSRWSAGSAVTFIELKPAREGRVVGKNARDTITRLKSAAAEFPWAAWVLVKGERGAFTEVTVDGGEGRT